MRHVRAARRCFPPISPRLDELGGERIDEIAALHLSDLPESDLKALRTDKWIAGIKKGAAAHHAGIPPIFKEIIERCFIDGLIKVVFATETLAVGMNMPAKTAVIGSLSKFNGEAHVSLTSLQFTQLTGRAGRRGIDAEGNSVVVWSPYEKFSFAASLASKASAPLASAFTPSYNTVASLAERYDRDGALSFVSHSFAQFAADEKAVAVANEIERSEAKEAEIAPFHAGRFHPHSTPHR